MFQSLSYKGDCAAIRALVGDERPGPVGCGRTCGFNVYIGEDGGAVSGDGEKHEPDMKECFIYRTVYDKMKEKFGDDIIPNNIGVAFTNRYAAMKFFSTDDGTVAGINVYRDDSKQQKIESFCDEKKEDGKPSDLTIKFSVKGNAENAVLEELRLIMDGIKGLKCTEDTGDRTVGQAVLAAYGQ
ncbi:MAG: hypothetical protein V1887_00175 [Candidatus Aenigmatarchaeota archaeon]